MTTSYGSLCDDFFVEMFVNTHLELPDQRDTLLTFFERLQKQFPQMCSFYKRENGDYCLESSRESGSYSWVAIEMERLCVGTSNPESLDNACQLQRAVLDLAPHMLGLSHLDISSLDVSFVLDFDYQGNQNEIIADALYHNSPLACMLDNEQASPVSLPSGFIVALDDTYRLQAKLMVESNSSLYEIKTNKFKESEPISLYFTLRQFPDPTGVFDSIASYDNQLRLLEELMNEKIIPNFVKPLTSSIAQRR